MGRRNRTALVDFEYAWLSNTPYCDRDDQVRDNMIWKSWIYITCDTPQDWFDARARGGVTSPGPAWYKPCKPDWSHKLGSPT
jgi:hypothetical protein